MNAQKILDLLRGRGMSQRQLAKILGMTPTGLNHIIMKGSTNTGTMEAIAQALEVPVSAFFDNTFTEASQDKCPDCTANRKIIEILQSRISDKDEIIAMLRSDRDRYDEIDRHHPLGSASNQ